MPLTRCQIRNEYGLADPELYRAADKDDPEALLEGVAMAGLVGVLRQLGDLAEFAAEIFHDLHEEVMATAARGHGLLARVQQLEAEVPSIEKAFLSQTNHSSFFSSAGFDWHPNLHMEHSVITRGGLPRFVMDSYEECRAPPRLFLLDKFDVAGAGACLKRYTDPSFFKIEPMGEISVEAPRDKKIRKAKKKGSHWRNGETPEVALTSHAKLHELFLEERVQNIHPDPACVVKLKRRQLNGFPFDVEPGKSYMEKVLEICSPDHKNICGVSVTPPALKLTNDNSSESGLEIVEISTVSPPKRSLQRKESACSSPNVHVVPLNPCRDELNGEAVDRGMMETSDKIVDGETDESPSSVHKMMIEEEIRVDVDGSLDGDNFDDLTSEVDTYMDALTTMESEMETNNDYRSRKQEHHLNALNYQMDSDRNDDQLDDRANFSDSQSIGISSISDDGIRSFKRGTYSFSFSDSSKSLGENMLFDGEVVAQVFSSIEDRLAETMAEKSNNNHVHGDTLALESFELAVSKDLRARGGKIHDPGETSSTLFATDSDMHLASVPVSLSQLDSWKGHESNDRPSSFAKLDSSSPYIEKSGTNLNEQSVLFPDTASQTRHDVLPIECQAANELDDKDTPGLSHALLHSVTTLGLTPETKDDNYSVNEVLQTEKTGAISDENLVVKSDLQHSVVSAKEDGSFSSTLPQVKVDLGIGSVPDISATAISDDTISQAADANTTRRVDLDNSSAVVDTSEAEFSKEHEHLSTTANLFEVECLSTEVEVPCSEEKLIELSGHTEGEKMGPSTNDVDSVGRYIDDPGHPYICLDIPGPKDEANLGNVESETNKVEDLSLSDVAASDTNSDIVGDFVCLSADLVSCQSEIPVNKQESLSDAEIKHQKPLDLMETVSPECLAESEVQKELEQLAITAIDLDSRVHNLGLNEHCNEGVIHHSFLMDETHNSLYVSDVMNVPTSGVSDQGLESNNTYQIHYLEESEDAEDSSTIYLPKAITSLEKQSNELQTYEIIAEYVQTAANESNSKPVTDHSSSTCYLPMPENVLEHPSPVQSNQLDRGHLQVIEASTNQSNVKIEQTETLNHPDTEMGLNDISNSCLELLSSQNILVKPAGEGLDGLKYTGNPFDSGSSSLATEPNHANMEEAPPLPPLPPMQWRLGRTQSIMQAQEKDSISDSHYEFPSIEPFAADQKAPIPSSDRMLLASSNPFLPIPTAGSQTSTPCISEESTMEESSFLKERKSQQDCVPSEGTESVNPFLSMQETSNEKLEQNFIPSGEDLLQSTPDLLSQVPIAEHITSEHDPMPSQGLSSRPLNQLAPMTTLEAKSPSQELEGEQGNHPEKSLMPYSVVTEQPQYDETTSKGDAKWPHSKSALAATYEVGRSNGTKLPRPRNPLIDAVAAHDKSKLRKMTERVRPQIGPKLEERNSLLEQIRTKSFNLKPATLARPSIQGIPGPRTNLRVAAILEKANAIRQAFAGSDEDDSDNWSDC
ncbi:hypothetical protein K2173_000112 [Erythroxylum novogranatense]|uniref:Protein SCAR n=1 Tax=Erythroxylum novogranatense TaxID=1862640 RepID=A0AAV8SPF9_9ROSI|nr:hypothetical protein K2173_000112 [Erythroxylum novogranatense]